MDVIINDPLSNSSSHRRELMADATNSINFWVGESMYVDVVEHIPVYIYMYNELCKILNTFYYMYI